VASLQVRVLAGDTQVRDYVLENEETVLGRSRDCDVVIPSVCSARRHARVIRIDDRFFVEDLNTLGGTRVNGPEIGNQIRERTLLRSGDTIWFGTEIVVQFQG
jgi:pSer/pThr/pTyr-binding forkhead associated (FHA) protein